MHVTNKNRYINYEKPNWPQDSQNIKVKALNTLPKQAKFTKSQETLIRLCYIYQQVRGREGKSYYVQSPT